MIDQADTKTADIFEGVKRGRGRPVTGSAMSNADRQRSYRQRLKSGQVIKLPTVSEMLINTPGEVNQEIESLRQALDRVVSHRDELLRELRQARNEINQLKTVTVTQNKGQGADPFQRDTMESLKAKLIRLSDELDRARQLLTDQTIQYDTQSSLMVEYRKEIARLKKRNVTKKQGPDTDNG